MKRLQKQLILKDLEEKYVFLGGPRQSGKTTLAKQLITEPSQVQYLNYDRREDRAIFIAGHWSRKVQLVVLDEVHKYPGWKTHLKGYFDTDGIPPSILVTGSAKLNTFKRGNDSMAGRYFYHRLLPLSVKELMSTGIDPHSALERLRRFGNFPDPFFKASETYSRRW